MVKYDGRGLWVSVYFKRAIRPVKPRTAVATDINFDNITLAVFTLNGKLVRFKGI